MSLDYVLLTLPSKLGCSARLTLTCFLMVGGIASITGTPCATMGHAAEAGVSPAELAPKLNLIKMATEYSTDSILII